MGAKPTQPKHDATDQGPARTAGRAELKIRNSFSVGSRITRQACEVGGSRPARDVQEVCRMLVWTAKRTAELRRNFPAKLSANAVKTSANRDGPRRNKRRRLAPPYRPPGGSHGRSHRVAVPARTDREGPVHARGRFGRGASISIPQHDGTVKRFPQLEHGTGAPRTRPGPRPRGSPFFPR